VTKRYATLSWNPADISALRPNWTEKQCRDWLAANEYRIRERLCEHGWGVIETLLPLEPEDEEIE
jgi:hypothetical protein